jgi:spore maturation protein CgeB
MKIGFKFPDNNNWKLNSLIPGQGRNFNGDEAMALCLQKELLKYPEVHSCELFNQYPENKLDVIVYLHREKPESSRARKHIVYFQNAYPEGNDIILKEFHSYGFDGYMFASKKLLQYHTNLGFNGLYLPFAVDPDFFKPYQPCDKYKFEVAYVGNNIKGKERTLKYVYPAIRFKFGLFGNWYYKSWKFNRPWYMRVFKRIARGQIPMEDLPVLYSSSKIILNCSIQGHADWDVGVGRVYDVMACNGFLISDEIPSMREKFGDIVEFSKGGKDLVKKIRYYLKHDDERLERARKGRAVILKSETYAHRAKDMLEYFKKLLS